MRLFNLPEVPLSQLGARKLRRFVRDVEERAREIASDPARFIAEHDLTADELKAEVAEMRAAVDEAHKILSERAEAAAEPEPVEPTEPDLGADLADLADAAGDLAADEPEEDDEEPEETDEPEEAAAVDEPEPVAEPEAQPVVASAPARRPVPSPRRAAPRQVEAPRVPLTAAVNSAEGFGVGDEIDIEELSRMMIRARRDFGHVAPGASEKITLGRADWSHVYGEDRHLTAGAAGENDRKIKKVVDDAVIRAELARRRDSGSLTASGGLCAPVANYYQIMDISSADRPVRAALPGFGADRGGINASAPATIGDITTAVGVVTMAEDAQGGTFATKTCQVIDCPPFTETVIQAIYHCIQIGNVVGRTYPELVAHWNSLVLAAHARRAEIGLLDGISAASTAVTAGDLNLGASANLPSQILTAAAAFRSFHRMADDAVLRLLLPQWVGELFVSDVYRTQFQRFDMTVQQFVAILRRHNVEPSFYKDSATGKGQIMAQQNDGVLNGFPDDVVWYLFPEGSFLYLDGGTLELGLVRDSVLNLTNDYQLFGETFENVAFVGVQSLEVTSTVCDSGAVSLPIAVTDCGDYSA